MSVKISSKCSISCALRIGNRWVQMYHWLFMQIEGLSFTGRLATGAGMTTWPQWQQTGLLWLHGTVFGELCCCFGVVGVGFASRMAVCGNGGSGGRSDDAEEGEEEEGEPGAGTPAGGKGFEGNREPVVSLWNSLAELMWKASMEFLCGGVSLGIRQRAGRGGEGRGRGRGRGRGKRRARKVARGGRSGELGRRSRLEKRFVGLPRERVRVPHR